MTRPGSTHETTRSFHKYEGTGNDFILLEWPDVELPPEDAIRALCDRRRGIGGDGLLLLSPPSPTSLARMILFNPDGSRPEMCGNGIRCAAFHALRWMAPPAPGPSATITIATDAGIRTCTVVPLDSREASVSVDMGTIPPPTPVHLDSPAADLLVTSAGNPHAVSFDEVSDDAFLSLGPELSTHPRFPAGVNVEFAAPVAHNRLLVRVWERGAGPTLACGTGACAAVAAAIHSGRLPHTPEVTVELPGGNLSVSWDPTTGHTRMTGPARRVFEGTVPWPWCLSSPA